MLVKAVIALAIAGTLLAWSAAAYARRKNRYTGLQLAGAGCLLLVAVAHLCEATHRFPWMHWGAEHSAGHYFDLASAVLGLTLFSIGFLFKRCGGSD